MMVDTLDRLVLTLYLQPRQDWFFFLCHAHAVEVVGVQGGQAAFEALVLGLIIFRQHNNPNHSVDGLGYSMDQRSMHWCG